MYEDTSTWALILAAGKGSRLRALTTSICGATVPKQFCSLHDGPSLLSESLFRARAVASNLNTCVVVAQQHRCWWEPLLATVPSANIVVRPRNRGTANGVLLPLLHIVERDPSAQIVILPSDHYVSDEAILACSLSRAVEQLQWRVDETVLLGLEPEQPDEELGYIVPGSTDSRGALKVTQFIEKPTSLQARELIDHGALWNAFILAASAQALLGLFRRSMPETVREMRAAVQLSRNDPNECTPIAELYERLPERDFSRDILPGQEARLRVLPVPQCGWSDLGTPSSVAQALRRARPTGTAATACATPPHAGVRREAGFLSLAAQHYRLHAAVQAIV